MGVRRGIETGIFSPWKLGLRKFSRKPKVSCLIPINWFFITDHINWPHCTKGQVQCSGTTQWWDCSSLMSDLNPAEAGCETCERLFYCLFLIFLLIACNATDLAAGRSLNIFYQGGCGERSWPRRAIVGPYCVTITCQQIF